MARRRALCETELQYYRDRAAGMLSVFATGERERDPAGAARIIPLAYAHAEADIRAAKLHAADAELIVAREHGFESSRRLAR